MRLYLARLRSSLFSTYVEVSHRSMEDLEEAMGSSLRVSLDQLDTCVVHPRYLDYKPKPTHESRQEERRRLLLEQQKKNRLESINLHRSRLPQTDEEVKKIETELNKGDRRKKHKNKALDSKSTEDYKGALMMSEWMVEVPPDLASNWIIKACPQGKRVLVVANKGWTKAYGRNGREIMTFVTALPGGSFHGGNVGLVTCLDCVLCPASFVLYVLDVIYWGTDLTHCDAEFRFFWLNSKMSELTLDKGNEDEEMEGGRSQKVWRYRLELVRTLNWGELEMLPHPLYPDNSPRLDGLLFYQKEGWYSWKCGKTPLVLWLKPFMLRDVLRMSIHPSYLQERPPQYCSPKMEVSKTMSQTSMTVESAGITKRLDVVVAEEADCFDDPT